MLVSKKDIDIVSEVKDAAKLRTSAIVAGLIGKTAVLRGGISCVELGWLVVGGVGEWRLKRRDLQ